MNDPRKQLLADVAKSGVETYPWETAVNLLGFAGGEGSRADRIREWAENEGLNVAFDADSTGTITSVRFAKVV